MANYDVFGGIVIEQDAFGNAQAVRHDDGGIIGVHFLTQFVFIQEPRHKLSRDRRVDHLLPWAEIVLCALGIRRGQHKAHATCVILHLRLQVGII